MNWVFTREKKTRKTLLSIQKLNKTVVDIVISVFGSYMSVPKTLVFTMILSLIQRSSFGWFWLIDATVAAIMPLRTDKRWRWFNTNFRMRTNRKRHPQSPVSHWWWKWPSPKLSRPFGWKTWLWLTHRISLAYSAIHSKSIWMILSRWVSGLLSRFCGLSFCVCVGFLLDPNLLDWVVGNLNSVFKGFNLELKWIVT